MKHTKGKWVMSYGAIALLIHSDQKPIAQINDKMDGDEMEANAILISKAPEMYEALKTLFNKCQSLPFGIDGIILNKVESILKEIEK